MPARFLIQGGQKKSGLAHKNQKRIKAGTHYGMYLAIEVEGNPGNCCNL